MRILFISDNFYPEVNAPASRTLDHCSYWVEMGHRVTVLTCVPNFPQGKVFKGYKNKFIQKEIINGIEVYRVWSYISANSGFAKRIIDFLSFALMAFLVGMFLRFDVIITTSPQFFVNFSGLFLKFFKRKKWVLELRDLYPESLKAVGRNVPKSIYFILQKLEILFYTIADLIVVVTNSFKEELVNKKVDKEKIHVILNGVNSEVFYPLNIKKKDNQCIIGYFGTHGEAHGLDFILKVAKKIQDINPEIKFHFYGDGSKKKELCALKDSLELKNVEFYGAVKKQMAPKIISTFDIGLVPLKNSKEFQKVIPSKIFELNAMGIPILLGVLGEAKELVENGLAGGAYTPEDYDSFIQSLNNIRGNKVNFKPGALSKKFNRQILAKKMIEIIERALIS